MSFPAYEDFAKERGVRHATFRVYVHLIGGMLDGKKPRWLKIGALCEALHMRPASVISAINWLVANGYLKEYDRGRRRERFFTIEYSRDDHFRNRSNLFVA